MPVSSRRITNCTRFWSRSALHPAAHGHLLADPPGQLLDQRPLHGRDPTRAAARSSPAHSGRRSGGRGAGQDLYAASSASSTSTANSSSSTRSQRARSSRPAAGRSAPSRSASRRSARVAHDAPARRARASAAGLRLGLAHLAQHVRRHLQRDLLALGPFGWRAPRRSAPPPRARAARWIDPSCHHDQTSSQTNGRNGANSRWKTDSESAQRPADRGAHLRRRGRSAGP